MNSRVLVAESDSSLRQQLYKKLLAEDIFSDCVGDAGAAVDCLQRKEYGFVLLDLGVSGGSEMIIAELQAMPENGRPIVVVTAAPEVARGIVTEIVQIVIRRPVHVAELAELISACVEPRPRVTFSNERRDEIRP